MKKKKLRPGTLAMRNLKLRKKQYAAMITGIILALVFASGFLYFFYCYHASTQILYDEEYGLQDNIIMHTNEKAIDEIQKNGLLEQVGYGHILGYIYATDDYKTNGVSVAWLDDTAKELANPILLTGAWPEKNGEIAIEQTALAQMGLKAEIGDTITVQMQVQNGDTLLDNTIEKTYVLTGILKDKRPNITYGYVENEQRDLPAAFLCAGAQTEPGGLEALAAYSTVTPLGEGDAMQDPIVSFLYDDIGNSKGNGYVIQAVDTHTYGNSAASIGSQFVQGAILSSVLLFAACAAVVNAFNTSLQARKKQIGMLRAVGATKLQIIKIYGTEALLITVICVPISILIAFFAVRGVISALSNDFVFVPNLWVLLLCGACGALFVMIAALIPLIAATRISPMQAIRNSNAMRKMKTRRIRTKKAFRLPQLLAARRTMFSKGRQVVVSIFLAIAIITSGYAFSYAAYMATHETETLYDYRLSLQRVSIDQTVNKLEDQNGFSESDRQAVLRSPYIESSTGYKNCNVNIQVDGFTDYLNMAAYYIYNVPAELDQASTGDDYKSVLWREFSESYTQYKPYMHNADYIPTRIFATDTETLEQLTPYLDNGAIDTDRINTGEEVILIAPDEIGVYCDDTGYLAYESTNDHTDNSPAYLATAKRDSDLTIGKELDLTFLFNNDSTSESDSEDETIESTDQHTTVGAVLSEIPHSSKLFEFIYSFFNTNSIVLLTSIDGLSNLAGNVPYGEITFCLNQPCTDEIDSSVQNILDEITMRVPNSAATSAYATEQNDKSEILFALSILLGIVLIALFFCGAIVNNTITADIRENLRELGTLRAVGASVRELSQAYIMQLVQMLGWGSAIGLGGFCGSYLIIWILSRAMDYGMEFTFMPWFSILFCLILFAVCSLNLYLKIKRETKNSIVDNIREL